MKRDIPAVELALLLSKLHTTELGEQRIRRNLKIDSEDLIGQCKKEIRENFKSIQKRGKNYYIETDKFIFTVNASNFTLITAHKLKMHSN